MEGYRLPDRGSVAGFKAVRESLSKDFARLRLNLDCTADDRTDAA